LSGVELLACWCHLWLIWRSGGTNFRCLMKW